MQLLLSLFSRSGDCEQRVDLHVRVRCELHPRAWFSGVRGSGADPGGGRGGDRGKARVRSVGIRSVVVVGGKGGPRGEKGEKVIIISEFCYFLVRESSMEVEGVHMFFL